MFEPRYIPASVGHVKTRYLSALGFLPIAKVPGLSDPDDDMSFFEAETYT